MIARTLWCSALLAGTAGPALAQDFNVDVGEPGSQPPASYAAAGQPGVWNSVRAEHVTPFTTGPTPEDDMLLDVNGQPTGVGFHQFGGMDHVTTNDPSVSGHDASLLNDYLATHSLTLENCMYLNGLEDGTYELITYAWMPNSPGTDQLVRWDFHPGSEEVGGAWPGFHVDGVTYSREIVQVTDGFLGWHVGIPAGGATLPGAAFNGFQLRRLGVGAVPALPRVGLVALAGLMLALGVWTLRRRLAPGAA